MGTVRVSPSWPSVHCAVLEVSPGTMCSAYHCTHHCGALTCCIGTWDVLSSLFVFGINDPPCAGPPRGIHTDTLSSASLEGSGCHPMLLRYQARGEATGVASGDATGNFCQFSICRLFRTRLRGAGLLLTMVACLQVASKFTDQNVLRGPGPPPLIDLVAIHPPAEWLAPIDVVPNKDGKKEKVESPPPPPINQSVGPPMSPCISFPPRISQYRYFPLLAGSVHL